MSFDARPLTEVVDKHAVKQFTVANRKASSARRGSRWVIYGFFSVVVAFIVATTAVTFLVNMRAGDVGPRLWMFAAVFVMIIVTGVLNVVRRGSSDTTSYRLSRFAQANNMSFLRTIDEPPLPGMLFRLGRDQVATHVVRGTRPRFVEFANYRYTTGSGKNETTHSWGYVAVKLDAPLPNIVLDAVGNNSLLGSNLPISFKKQQRLSLEGDFDRYFELYCPTGYERDALYLFTPDIMARFIDNAAQFDVEIVDDWLFLYTRRQVSTLDPATWAWLFGTVGALLTKIDQWARWRDERLRMEHVDAVASTSVMGNASATAVLPFASSTGSLTPPPGVADEGRRLKRGVPKAAIIGIGVVFAVFALQNLVFPLLMR